MSTPVVLQSDLLRLPGRLHGFTTRQGGVSEGVFASLNFSPKWPEDLPAVEQNHQLLAAHLGYDRDRLYRVFQVHGADGVCVNGQSVKQVYAVQADYLVTGRPGVTVGVITADCVPVLLADVTRPAVAAVHAGWRGLVSGVIGAAVARMADEFGSPPGDLRAALGPCIGPCCFEVGFEVVDEFQAAFPGADHLVHPPGTGPAGQERPHIDLWSAARLSLAQAGLDPAHIDAPPACTMCHPDRFHSYRREGPRVGQQLSVIGLTADGGQ
jgi:YfiH family protein